MNLYYKLKNKLIYDVDSLRARIQRFKRGYSYGDIWDMDYWFMRTVKPMLIHLRDHGIGVPNDLYLQDADNERIIWENTLTEMISCLELMDEDNAEKYLGIKDDDYSVESYKKVTNLMEESKNRFFELFSKHYYSLWD
jgi:hypothetical protein